MVVQQYPHRLIAKFTTESDMDEDGNIIPGASVELEFPCRYRQNPGAKTIKNSDNVDVVYQGTCLINSKDTGLKYGDQISVPGFVPSATILAVLPHQFRTRIIF